MLAQKSPVSFSFNNGEVQFTSVIDPYEIPNSTWLLVTYAAKSSNFVSVGLGLSTSLDPRVSHAFISFFIT